ncbi:FG-GAP repeat domain-containing protein [Amycolatopsis sp. BJA-103]|uniref:FG-GAP repeat domain-containing protein n=3 Tax=Amycolatopsis sp. BJA-103 TaxID=1911175 RepID=UPI00130525C5|nr:VCBS repeat-containing protein [Amycolatopsis sp. BJA-103]
MSYLNIKAVFVGVVSVVLMSVGLPAAADPVTDEMAANLIALPCVAGGPTPSDASLANELNPLLGNKMRGHMNAYRVSCARAIIDEVKAREFNERAGAIAIATVIVETSISNYDGGDADSVGLYQQRAGWGSFEERTNPAIATGNFLREMVRLYSENSWNFAPIGDVAANVQRPREDLRYKYGVEAGDATIIAHKLWTGETRHGSSLSGDARAEIVALQGDGTATAWFNARGFAEPPWGGDSKKIATGLGAPNTVRMADLDGDGRKEFISVQPNGDIVAWYNALGFAEMPWGGDSKKIGVGFTDPSRVFFADLSGDGKAEIIVLQPDGVLTAWYNALGFEAMPWGASKTIGTGFSDPARIRFADLSGDGKAEIMSIQPDGTITAWYNALGFETMPWGAAKTVGTGFTEPSRVLFADISGDGKAEIVTVQPDGTVTAWYNALGFETMPWGPSATLGAGFPEPARVLFA